MGAEVAGAGQGKPVADATRAAVQVASAAAYPPGGPAADAGQGLGLKLPTATGSVAAQEPLDTAGKGGRRQEEVGPMPGCVNPPPLLIPAQDCREACPPDPGAEPAEEPAPVGQEQPPGDPLSLDKEPAEEPSPATSARASTADSTQAAKANHEPVGSASLPTLTQKLAHPRRGDAARQRDQLRDQDATTDRSIVEHLAASSVVHNRLLKTARAVRQILTDSGPTGRAREVELYGSLSLDMSTPYDSDYVQDWSSHYVNALSDIDYVVLLDKDVSPSTYIERLTKDGPWKVVRSQQVPKFASTQFTLVADVEEQGVNAEVYLDLTCITSMTHFLRFKQRQEAFRRSFGASRWRMEARYKARGALAFDAYIFLLKAFAARVPSNALTGFQAICIGLFALQLPPAAFSFFRMSRYHPTGMALFEGFLRFVFAFYSDRDPSQGLPGYRECSIDISQPGSPLGRLMPRFNPHWRSEMYFMDAECQLESRPCERVNITHSLIPSIVAMEAKATLARGFTPVPGCSTSSPQSAWKELVQNPSRPSAKRMVGAVRA